MIVPFPIAVALKDEGYFPEETLYKSIYVITKYVDDEPVFTLSNVIENKDTLYKFTEATYFNLLNHVYLAPTLDEVINWFRVEHNIHINIMFSAATRQHILKIQTWDEELKSFVTYHAGKDKSPLKSFVGYEFAQLHAIQIMLSI